MPRKKSHKKIKEPEYCLLSIAIDEYKARTNAGPNLQIVGTARYLSDDEEHAIVCNTKLELSGICIDPVDRAGDHYEITLYGESTETGIQKHRIRDLHRMGENGIHEYRKYRGHEYPVYEQPPELGLLDKVRGENMWTAWVTVSHQMITDALICSSSDLI